MAGESLTRAFKLPPPPARRQAARVLLALAIGAAGGATFDRLGLPLPWMLGSMSAVTAAALAGVDVRMMSLVRGVMITVLGVMLGSAFTPEVVARMANWLTTLSAMALWMVVVGAIAHVYFRKVAGYDPVTAFFSATPGGLNEMVIVGGQMGGDDRTISITHAARIMFVVFAISFWFRLSHGIAAASGGGRVGLFDLAVADVTILVFCAVAGALGARRLGLPAAYLVGPMVLSASAHLGGLTASKPPFVVVAVAQIVVGSAIGCRFGGVPLARVGRAVAHSLVAAVAMLAVSVLFGLVLAPMMGLDLPAVVLAFAPGGLAEMSLIALALAVDAAFVSSHHIVRIVLVVTLAPVLFAWTRGRSIKRRE